MKGDNDDDGTEMDLLGAYDSDSTTSSVDKKDDESKVDVEVRANQATEEPEQLTPTPIRHNNRRNIQIVSSTQNNNVKAEAFVRSKPHVPGNWSGHVYVPIPASNNTAWKDAINESLVRFQIHLEDRPQQKQQQDVITTIVSHVDEGLHLSLSRPFVLQLSSISSFVECLQQRLQYLPTTTLRVSPGKEQILVNDDQTRSFWTWPVDENPTLISIIDQINTVLQRYKQAPYYDPPKFHISLASVAGDLLATAGNNNNNNTISAGNGNNNRKRKAPTTSSSSDNDHEKTTTVLYLPIRQLQCTFGTTKQYTIHLQQ